LTFPTTLLRTPSAPQAISLSNTGNAPLTISNIALSGTNSSDFTQTNSCGSTLAPGSSCNINLTFLPTASGPRSATVSVSDNAPGSPHQETVKGVGTVVTLFPGSLTFGAQTVGTTSSSQGVVFTNTSRIALNISGVSLSGSNAADFAQTNNCGSTVAAGATCTINVTFTPKATGARTASLLVSDNGGGSPQSASLGGTGQ
jgi:hypothetical protein